MIGIPSGSRGGRANILIKVMMLYWYNDSERTVGVGVCAGVSAVGGVVRLGLIVDVDIDMWYS